MNIRELFDPGKDIYRTIEKVITYGASQENRLKAEISEYVVTESIEDQFHKLLDRMQLAMEAGGEHEIGVWVSGFYGSGKSSFTKYLGLAFDSRVMVDGIPFLRHLQDRFHTPQVKALLNTVSQRFPAAVVLLDLASEMLAGATMEDVSSVLYYKILQWAGYSRNLKVAALERRLEKDGRYQEFCQRIEDDLPGLTWKEMQNDPLVVDGLIPQIAHEFYPALFPKADSFSSRTEDFIQFEDQRVKEMIDIVREKSGKQSIIFIIDEVGQYVASRDNMILNLDGLAKNLKRIGAGKVWIISTAQQTLTEETPSAILNSDKLFKLKDRFPIQVDLESSDIKEICYRRLLGKSPTGETELGKLFDAHGPELRHHTKLRDAKYYEANFDRKTFTNLYPFLPAHFDILLHLLGALAKSTGGVGLRSAIKVIQDILVEGSPARPPVADQPVGWLATTVTLYDTLEKDIRRAFPSIYDAVTHTCHRFTGSQLHAEISKSIAVLQILGNMPVTVENLAGLMHPAITAPSRLEDIRKAVEEMRQDHLVPLGDKDGSLCFLSEKVRDIEKERGSLSLKGGDVRRIFNDALREVFEPLPRATLQGTLTVTAGLKTQSGATVIGLAGDSHPIQILTEFADAPDYEAAKTRLLEESRKSGGNQNTLYLLGRSNPDTESLAADMYRSQRISDLHRNDPNQEVRDYCNSQMEHSKKLHQDLRQKIKQTLSHGSFLFRGQATAVSALQGDLHDAARKHLGEVACQVFERYSEAPVRVETTGAEKFLKVGSPSAITHQLDPLGLVEIVGNKPRFRTDHKAMVSIRDYISRQGQVDGKRLLEHFSEAPFGWSQDTVRYILAAMLTASEIKLKVSGREVLVAGPQAIEALKTNKSFAPIGVLLRDERPSMDILGRAADRLTELVGDMVIPLEQDIGKATTKHFPNLLNLYAPLSEKLKALQLAGVERVTSLNQDISDLLSTDGSDAPQRLGAEESAIYTNLKWASEVKTKLEQGLETTIRELQNHRREILDLPSTGIPGDLRNTLAETLELIGQRLGRDDFYQHIPDLNSKLTSIKTEVRFAVGLLQSHFQTRIKEGIGDLKRLPEWSELTQEEQTNAASRLETLQVTVTEDVAGLKQLLNRVYELTSTIEELKTSIRKQSQERLRKRLEEERREREETVQTKYTRSIHVPATVTNTEQLDDLIRQLQALRLQLELYGDFEVYLGSVRPA
ncbi:MAG: BREX system P-loop protein BrxC [Blastocatellia bacterium]|nr:BREX system P-loop protein BrxC [Blastocatellia bacterium]